VLDERHSRGWQAARPTGSVVIATHGRASWLRELLQRLDAGLTGCEVLVADDGSADSTWSVLTEWTARTALPAAVLRLAACGGPSVPRNTAATRSRGDVLVFTDDDCLPESGWGARLTVAGRQAIAQGRTRPLDDRTGPWDRTIEVERLTGLWETCNLAMPRDAFLAAGGFPVLDLLGAGGRGFGEDVLLGASVARRLPSVFVHDAVVRHRWVPSDFRGHLASRWRLAGFPALLAEVPELRESLWRRPFLTRRTAAVDAGLVSVGLRKPWGAAPWAALALRDARSLPGPVGTRLAQVLVADLVGTAALATGSVRSGRWVL
jgi:hypothetical protein